MLTRAYQPPSSIFRHLCQSWYYNCVALSLCGISFIGQNHHCSNGQERPIDCANCNLFSLTIEDRSYTNYEACEAPNSLLVRGILQPRLHSQSMTDIPSGLFGSNLSWFCKNYTDLLNLFNKNSPLSNQASWTVFSPFNAASMKVISVLRMQHFEMGEWLELKNSGKHVGKIGVPLSDLWEWSLGYRMPRTSSKLGA